MEKKNYRNHIIDLIVPASIDCMNDPNLKFMGAFCT